MNFSTGCSIEPQRAYDAIYSGVQWFDDRGMEVNAHGACIVEEDGKYYLFGEFKSDSINAFAGFSCYSSTDLMNWKFEKMVLTVQDSGKLGPRRVGERVKVLKCPQTGEYVMYMHTDNMTYTDQCVGYATSKTINGTYTFHGALLFDGEPIRKWDMGVFQDTDGSGYLVTHSGNLFRLSDDYKSVTQQIVKGMTRYCESPAIFKKDGIYYWLGSDLTSWERNDNYYFTATSLEGPWTERGFIAPEGTLTWNSQSTYVLRITGSKDTTYMYMGDRWSYPRQQAAATYVWQPLVVSGNTLGIPEFNEAWHINTNTGEWKPNQLKGKTYDNDYTGHGDIRFEYTGEWQHIDKTDTSDTKSISNTPGSSLSVKFNGYRIALYGISGKKGGYARVVLTDLENQEVIVSTITDFYSKYTNAELKFISPLLKKSDYLLEVSVMGEHGVWYSKNGTVYGSTGDNISIDKIIVEK